MCSLQILTLLIPPWAKSGSPKENSVFPKGKQVFFKAVSWPEHLLERNMIVPMKEKFYLIQPIE